MIKNGVLVDGGGRPKDPAVCAVKDLKSDSLIVDPKGKGIGHIFIYLRKAPKKIHPALKDPPKTKLKFDQKGCRFIPHTLFVRTGQTVLVLSDDNCIHNTHTFPFYNDGENFAVAKNDRKGKPLVFENLEKVPMKVKCDFHTFMTAYWMVLDHPYGAITVSKAAKNGKGKAAPEIGTFRIDKLPEGDYEFVVWHERAYYIRRGAQPGSNVTAGKRGFKVTVKGDVKDLLFEIPAERFASD